MCLAIFHYLDQERNCTVLKFGREKNRGDPRGRGSGKIFPRDRDRGRGTDSPAGRGSGKYPPLPIRPIDIPIFNLMSVLWHVAL